MSLVFLQWTTRYSSRQMGQGLPPLTLPYTMHFRLVQGLRFLVFAKFRRQSSQTLLSPYLFFSKEHHLETAKLMKANGSFTLFIAGCSLPVFKKLKAAFQKNSNLFFWQKNSTLHVYGGNFGNQEKTSKCFDKDIRNLFKSSLSMNLQNFPRKLFLQNFLKKQ